MSPFALLGGLFSALRGLPAWLAVGAVFLLPALEASAFLGIVVPGELGVVLGGAIVSQGYVPLAAVLAAGILGAILGDSVGYWVGERWGEALLSRFTGRMIRPERVEKAKRYLEKHPARAIALGRFPSGLRTIVPGLAGMSRVPYARFLAWNVVGGILWAGGFVLLGYFAGRSWSRVEHLATWGGLALLVATALWFVGKRSYRKGRLGRVLASRKAA